MSAQRRRSIAWTRGSVDCEICGALAFENCKPTARPPGLLALRSNQRPVSVETRTAAAVIASSRSCSTKRGPYEHKSSTVYHAMKREELFSKDNAPSSSVE